MTTRRLLASTALAATLVVGPVGGALAEDIGTQITPEATQSDSTGWMSALTSLLGKIPAFFTGGGTSAGDIAQCPGGSCPGGDACPGGSCPGTGGGSAFMPGDGSGMMPGGTGSCPGGVCPGGSCPGGVCPGM